MKYLQVGILVALVAVAVLLGLNLVNDRTPQEPEAIPSAAATPLPGTGSPELTPAEVSAEVAAGTYAAAGPDHESEASAATVPPKPPPNSNASRPSESRAIETRSGARTASAATKPETRETAASTGSAKPSPAMSSPAKPSAPDPAPNSETERVESASANRPDMRSVPPAAETPDPASASSTDRYELMRPESKEAATVTPTAPPRTVTIPAGTILTIRTVQTLSSRSNAAGDTFAGSLDQPMVFEDLVIAERGSRVEGKVVEVTESGRVKGLAQLVVQLTKINTSDGQTINVRTQNFTMEAEKTTKSDATKVGIATGIGAALGAIFGGGKGAAIGAAAGAGAGGGSVLASKGKPAEIPSETRINFRLEQPLTITEKINP